MFAKTEIDLLIEVVVKREKAKGYSDTEARVFALGYLSSFCQKHFIDSAPKARQKHIRMDVLERIACVAGDL
jgi:hypothetical protein